MNLSRTLFSLMIASSLLAFKTDKPAYLIFDTGGKVSSYEKLIREAAKADIVLFGEFHDNPIAHWLEYEVAKDLQEMLAEKGIQLVLGAEMFESDEQELLDEYLNGQIDQRNFEQQARLWPNYKTDYRPLVVLAKEKNIPFIATNVPRRYASIVSKKGFEGLDSLNPFAYQWMAPLPIVYDPELPAYKEMLQMAASHGANENLPKAQAIKDATMSFFILKNFSKGKTFLHFHGAYHSDKRQGITWYLNETAPDLKVMTISTVTQDDLDSLRSENLDRADFIIAVPESMTRTQ